MKSSVLQYGHVSFAVQIERFGVDKAGDGRKEKYMNLRFLSWISFLP